MEPIDMLWLLASTALVLLMQAGFLLLEAGMTRAKNYINVAVKNMVDLGAAIILFWLVGYGIMFGADWADVVGTTGFAIDFTTTAPGDTTFFLFQAVFAGTTVTIISGAIAERAAFRAYLAIVFVMGAVYPVFGHWVWAGDGWLTDLGFVDFAGSTVVHSVGGWAALAAVIAIGPRLGRFDADGTPRSITPSNLPMAMVGGILLWFGWIGFNGGSVLAFDDSVPGVVMTTMIGGAAGLIAALLLSWRSEGYVVPAAPLNGALAGLVAVTAGAHVLSSAAALGVGAVGGIIAMRGEHLLERLRIDDAVGAIPVHLFAGAWGTLAVGLFGRADRIGTDLGRLEQVGVQAIGIGAAGAWTFGVVWCFLSIVKRFIPLRVEPEHEIEGLNVAEHNAPTALLDLVENMQRQSSTGAIGDPIDAEPFTEVGEIAGHYNQLTEQLRASSDIAIAIAEGRLDVDVVPKSEQDVFGIAFRRMVRDLRDTVRGISNAGDDLRTSIGTLRSISDELEAGVETQVDGVGAGSERFEAVRAQIEQLGATVEELAQHSTSALDALVDRMSTARSTAERAGHVAEESARQAEQGSSELIEAVRAIEDASSDITRVVDVVRSVAEATRILALNASIEAARAGDAGTAFSVVAQEVQALADDTLGSVDEIADAIATLQQASTGAVGVADGVLGSLVELASRTHEDVAGLGAVAAQEVTHATEFQQTFRSMRDAVDERAARLRSEADEAESAMQAIGEVSERTVMTVSRLRELESDVATETEGLHERLDRFELGSSG